MLTASLRARETSKRVIGNGIHGSLNVLFTRVKYNNKLLKGHTTLIGLLTMCIEAKESPTPVASVKINNVQYLSNKVPVSTTFPCSSSSFPSLFLIRLYGSNQTSDPDVQIFEPCGS